MVFPEEVDDVPYSSDGSEDERLREIYSRFPFTESHSEDSESDLSVAETETSCENSLLNISLDTNQSCIEAWNVNNECQRNDDVYEPDEQSLPVEENSNEQSPHVEHVMDSNPSSIDSVQDYSSSFTHDEVESDSSDYDHRSDIADMINDATEDDFRHSSTENSYNDLSFASSNSNYDYGLTKLFKFINDNENNETIMSEITVSTAEILLAVLKYALVNSLTQTAIADLFKMLNYFFRFRVLPSSRYLVDKMFSTDANIQYHAVCPTCEKYVSTFNRSDRTVKCGDCNLNIELKDPTYNKFFATIDVRHEISNLLENNADHYNRVVHERLNNHRQLNDITDGVLYKRFVNSLPPDVRGNYATVIFNSDGSSTFRSSKFSIWPIQIMVNELPFQVRTSKSMVCGIWFGKDKPKMNVFLKPFVSYMNELSDDGIQCKIHNEVRNIKIFPIVCCVDSVARPPMQGLIQYNGHFGCNWCEHPGIYVRSNRGTGGSIKYLILEEPLRIRTEMSMYRHMYESVTSQTAVYGVKNPSCLINLRGFDIVSSFVPDGMHCINLGIAEQFLCYWINEKNMNYSISKEDSTWIDNIMSHVKVPNQVERLSRTVKERKFWKALEYENWILHYSLPILLSLAHMQEMAKHWALLVEVYHILLKESITYDEVNAANDLLKRFVVETEIIYSETAMTFNIHQLLHLAQSVADWGPLWAHFGYGFENGNGTLLKKIHAAKGVIHQICRNITMNQSELLLRRHFSDREDSIVKQYVEYLESKSTNQTLKLANRRYFGANTHTDERWIIELNLSDSCRTYQRMVKNGCLYTSLKRKNMRSDNSFAVTQDGTYIRMKEFLVDVTTRNEFTICKVLKIENIFGRPALPNKIIVSTSSTYSAINTANIERVCVFMELNDARYISAVPNLLYY